MLHTFFVIIYHILFSLSFFVIISLSFNFVFSLITKEFIQPKMIVMIFPEIDETTWTGKICRIPSEHTTYVRLMYIQFRLCSHKH